MPLWRCHLARNLFGGTADSVAEDITGARVPNAVGTVWDGPSAGAAQLTDLTNIDGAPILQLQADIHGFVAAFYGPDGYERLWVDFGGGSRVALVSVTIGERLDAHLTGIDPHGDRAYSDAQDATHRTAVTNVHGVTGNVVGTTDTQTLSGKTLTSPTINAGVLSGIFTGNPNFTGLPKLSGAVSGTDMLGINVTGDGFDRVRVTTEGKFSFGSGSANRDTTLYRSGVSTLTTDGALVVGGTTTHQGSTDSTRPAASNSAYTSKVTTDAVVRHNVMADGKHEWGDGTNARDAVLYRSAAGTLKTDTAFVVGGDLTVSSTTWSTYTPAVTNGGTVTWNQQVGWYKKFGKLVLVEIYLAVNAAGSGTTGITISLPSTPYRDGGTGAATTRQFIGGYCGGIAAGTNSSVSGGFSAMILAGGSGAIIDQLRGPTDIIVRGEQLGTSTIITIQGWYREA